MLKFKYKNLILLSFILFVSLFIFVHFISLQGLLAWDEPVYLANSRTLISESYFSEDFRFPLLGALIAGVWLFTGESILVAQILMVLISLSTIVVFYFISKYFVNDNFALLASALFAFSLQFITWGFKIYTDILGMLLVLLSFLFLLNYNDLSNKLIGSKKLSNKSINKLISKEKNYDKLNRVFLFIKNNYLIFLAGLFAGLAFSARLSTIIISFVLVLFFLFIKGWFKNLLIYGVGFITAVLPWLIHGFLTKGNPLYFALAQTSAILEYTTREAPIKLIRFLFVEFGLALLLIFANVIYFLFFFSNKYKFSFNLKYFNISEFKKVDMSKIFLLIIILFVQLIFYLYFVKLKLSRYILELSPFIILLILLGANALIFLSKKKFKNLVAVFLSIIIFISVLLPSMIGFGILHNVAVCKSTGAIKQSIDFVNDVSEPGQLIVSSVWPYYGYYANLRAFSPWTDDLNDLFESHDPDFLAFSNSFGIPFTGEINRDDVIKIASFNDSCGDDITIYEVVK